MDKSLFYLTQKIFIKMFTKILTIIIIISATISISSCDKNGQDDYFNNSNSSSNENSSNIQQVITDNVYVSYYYADYAYYISLSTNLDKELVDNNIYYSMIATYTNDFPNSYGTIGFYWDIDDGCIRIKSNADRTQFDIIASIFIDDEEFSPYIEESFYWSSYMALKDKGNLTQDERELYNSCIKYMDKVEYEAKKQLELKIQVSIDGKSYTIKTIRQ